MQNLLGNVITFNSLYKKIEEATEADNMKEIYFWYGRFTILFIDFEPLVEDDGMDDEVGFEDDTFISEDVPLISNSIKQSSFGRRVSP